MTHPPRPAKEASQATTHDTLLGGKVHVFQPAKGFRAGLDSVLLGAGLAGLGVFEGNFGAGRHLLELGCGAGGALFPAAHYLSETRFTGLERDEDMAALARQGVAANGFGERIEIVAGEAYAFTATCENGFDLVFSNPPYFQAGHILQPGEGKSGAYLESLSLDDWLKAMLFATAARGGLLVIHRAAELARILARLDKQAGEICVLPVRPYPGAPASRVLVSARKGLRSGDVKLLAGLDLHVEKGGALTERAEEVMQGARLDWA